MKTIGIAFVLGASMLVFSSTALAAVVIAEPAGVDWSGFYTGLHGGWGWADAESGYGNDAFNEPVCGLVSISCSIIA